MHHRQLPSILLLSSLQYSLRITHLIVITPANSHNPNSVNEAESTHHRRRVYSSPSTTLIVKLSFYILLTATLAMADPLSLSATVIGIATTGFAVALGLYQIADGIGSAGREVRLYADEVGGFSKMLKMVGT
jgi:hypothetical protein